ncbi:hypothetical protein [Jannaschia sp. CCS1]|uniref:hypothetical protein n=1 Tax=Jannaschia sp. (strain CCS1) TaxID=290400 RepID=UPI000053C7B2|nr:hypothetical protein [Jannaschia sp. CCS1]ABD52953.1 hypothetical protein Jann_0036 [Jannaschia sp. CCS1]
MKTKFLIAALTMALAAPAFAQVAPMQFAVQHYNQSTDGVLEQISMPDLNEGVTVSTQGNTALADAMDIVGDDVLGVVTVFPSEPTYGADILNRLASE